MQVIVNVRCDFVVQRMKDTLIPKRKSVSSLLVVLIMKVCEAISNPQNAKLITIRVSRILLLPSNILDIQKECPKLRISRYLIKTGMAGIAW